MINMLYCWCCALVGNSEMTVVVHILLINTYKKQQQQQTTTNVTQSSVIISHESLFLIRFVWWHFFSLHMAGARCHIFRPRSIESVSIITTLHIVSILLVHDREEADRVPHLMHEGEFCRCGRRLVEVLLLGIITLLGNCLILRAGGRRGATAFIRCWFLLLGWCWHTSHVTDWLLQYSVPLL